LFSTELYSSGDLAPESRKESAENKIKDNLIRKYYNTIKESDSVLILNLDKEGIKNYMGGNSFIEMAFAHVLNKKIFLYNPIPQMIYSDEIITCQPTIINQNLNLIK
jgi:hypothetical protein